MGLSHQTIASIVSSLIELRELQDNGCVTGARVTDFVIGQYQRMPDYLRYVLAAALFLFALMPVLHTRKPFHALPQGTRHKVTEQWRSSRFRAARDFILFFEHLTLFGWYALHGK